MLAASVIFVNLAFLIYSVSILNFFRRKTLLSWHTIMFWIGFVFDTAGTVMMYKLGGSVLKFGLHDILGYIALVLMFLNAVSALFVLHKKKDGFTSFYKFSFLAWLIWIVSYVLGILTHV